LFAEELVRERQAQFERECAHARLLQEAAHSRPRRAEPGVSLRRFGSGGKALVGRWLVHTGVWLQSVGTTPPLAAAPVEATTSARGVVLRCGRTQ
jgi:hypothetical protein